MGRPLIALVTSLARAWEAHGRLRRPKLRAALTCEALEGRRLLSEGGVLGTPLRRDFQKLHGDLAAIRSKSQVTPQLAFALRGDLDAITKMAVPPDPQALKILSQDSAALFSGDPAQRARWVSEFTAFLKSASIAQPLIDVTIADIQSVVKASNVTPADVKTIADDQKAIEADLGNAATGNELGGHFGLVGLLTRPDHLRIHPQPS